MGVPVKKTGKDSSAPKPEQPEPVAEDYFMEAEVAYFSDDIEGARAAFNRALELEPENEEFLDAYCAFLAENGPHDEALETLQKAVELFPDHGFEKYMYYGQVLDSVDRSKEAEDMMRRGIEILRKDLAELDDHHAGHPELDGSAGDEAAEELAEDRENLREALSSALCSLAELLMGNAADAADDADDEDGAAAGLAASPALVECEKLLGEARELWPKSPEPLQALCSLRKLQGREEDALALLRQSLELWYRPDAEEVEIEEGEEGAEKKKPADEGKEEESDDDEDDDESDMDEDDMGLPSYEFRFEAAKLLLELDDTMEIAADVLEGLLQENDTVPDVWLLLAVAYRAGGELEMAADAAKEGVETARKLGLSEDHEVVAALGELESELGKLVLDEEAQEADEEKKE